MSYIPHDCWLEILRRLNDKNKLNCRLISLRINKLICDHVVIDRYLTPVYIDKDHNVRIISDVRNIGLLLPLYVEDNDMGRLLDDKIDDILGKESLQVAAEKGDILIVKSLLSNPNVVPEIKDSAGLFNMKDKTSIIVNLILDCPRTNIKELANSTFRWACTYNFISVFDRLLNHPDCNINSRENYPLRIAAEKGYVNIVEKLLRYKECKVTLSCILKSIEGKNVHIVKMMLKYTKPDYQYSDDLLEHAIQHGTDNIIDLVLENFQIDLWKNDNEILILAVRYGRKDLVTRIVSDPRVTLKGITKAIESTSDNKEIWLLRRARRIILSPKK